MNLFKSTKATTYISSRGDKVYPIIMDIKTGIVEGDAVFTTGDIDTAYLYATILEEQSDYNILGSTVICNIQRPDGTTMKVQGDVLGNNLIEFPLGQSGVSQEGVYNFDIAVVFSEKKMVTSPTAQYSVTQSIEVIGEIEEDDRFPVLESLISGINVINEEELVRVSNEEVRQSKEEAREQAESVRARNEEVRLANNEAIRNEEAVRVTNENERKNAESLRVQEENKRKQQENTRIAQENTRVSQETARVNAENTRKNQEATRQANEATRVSQETNRSQAESTRNSNETVRQNQENTRKNQEQARVTAEGNRVTSENVRVSAEQARVLKEQERQAIEVERQNSESTREQQELTRVSQENARKQADILRQQEHEERQQFLNGFEGKLNTVVDDVATIKDDVVSVREANKRQDVFLQGLYNENLDGRVTVKEEGSVISLTNSDNGLVDIIGLEGNTLVNYVTDGAKELTLNGDIEAEGTNVTLTDTVDNGLVDAVCEGNTLVNLSSVRNFSWTFTNDNNWEHNYFLSIQPIKPSTQYTFIINVTENTTNQEVVMCIGGKWNTFNGKQFIVTKGLYKVVATSYDTLREANKLFIQSQDIYNGVLKFEILALLEGDWTNKEVPEYFEGMKSVGECEDNKLEIVSQNKNLFDGEYELGYIDANRGYVATPNTNGLTTGWIKCKPNTKYRASGGDRNRWLLRNKDGKETIIGGTIGSETPTVTTLSDTTELRCYFRWSSSNEEVESVLNSFQIEEGATRTTYTKGLLNKKEITLSEPLRALPNGVCDKIVKIGGKHYVERNCGEIVLNGSENWVSFGSSESTIVFYSKVIDELSKTGINIHCDKFIPRTKSWSASSEIEGIQIDSDISLTIQISKSKLTTTNISGFNQWLSENPTTVIYELQTPIYEELPIDPTLNTYNDITHISNNSTIPCNMKVTNTGYNAIIKPSTQYTVAFDTNKVGEVGINLGGSKVTTTNNVATVTTPSTLVDDSLRLCGKGIKASKVRLLEGDKTNWIPSYFEGMKSSFEDKLQDDGTFKMEILSNNKNLLNIEESISFGVKTIILDRPLEPGTYCISYEKVSGHLDGKEIHIAFNKEVNGKNVAEFSLRKRSTFTLNERVSVIYLYANGYNYVGSIDKLATIDKLQIEKGTQITSYKPRKSNKIQFSSIEPLRGVGDVKDRFVFKDGKLMIERNCGVGSLNGTSATYHCWTNNQNDIVSGYIYYNEHKPVINNIKQHSNIICVNLPNNRGGHISTVEGFRNTSYLTFSIHKSKLGIQDINAGIPNEYIVKQYFMNHPLDFIYQVEIPTYEEVPYEAQKLILEGYINGTLFLDTNIPPTVEANYTANIPVVSVLTKNSNEIVITQEDLSVTQVAVDFLLMSNIGEEMLSSFNINTKGRNNMGAYFANRITKGALKYEDVINKYPQYKEVIDSILETK